MGSSAWTSKVCGLALLLAWGCGGGDSGGGGGGTGGSPREPSDATPLPLPFDAAGGGTTGGTPAGGETGGTSGGAPGGALPPPCGENERRCAATGAVEICRNGAFIEIGPCPEDFECRDGMCVEATCEAQCEGRQCGADGCGASCGECVDGSMCSAEGLCVAVAGRCGDDVCEAPLGEDCATCAADCGNCCGDGTCDVGREENCATCLADCACPGAEVCDAAAQACRPCMPLCEGRECGPNTCGGTCGVCDADAVCNNGRCDVACVAQCDGRVCGDDGCGGRCGVCPANDICNGLGQCEAPPAECGDAACGPNENCGNCPADCGPCCGNGVCQANFAENCATCPADCGCPAGQNCDAARRVCEAGCVPQCMGRDCGDDGCEGVCGACGAAQACVAGVCRDQCQPQCLDRECGGNGCGGSCGECAADEVCDDGACVPECVAMCNGLECGPDGCGGQCGVCAGDERCAAGLCVPLCEPACDGLNCGDDGCGGVCGVCDADEVCAAGRCRALVPFCDCTPEQVCLDGLCRAPELLCSAENPVGLCVSGQNCVVGACVDAGAACSPQNPTGVCTLGEVCRNGECVPFDAAALCDDLNTCTRDVFDFVRNRCTYELLGENDGQCDDGNGCTQDFCLGGACIGEPIAGCIEPPSLDPYTSPTNVNSVTLAGDKPIGSAIYINGEVAVAENPDPRWSVRLNLVPGENVYSITSRDRGQESAPVVARIVYDITAPTLTLTPAGGVFLNAVTMTVTSNEPATVYFTDDGGTPDEWSRSFRSVKQFRIFSNTTLRFRARDTAGNWMAAPVDAAFEITSYGARWAEGPTLPEPRTLHVASLVDTSIWVAGGTDGLAPQAGVFRFDLATGQWVVAPALAVPRTQMASASLGGYFYVIGGENDGNPLNLVQRIRAQDAAWANMAPMPSTRFGLTAVPFNNRLYVFGGQGNGGQVLTNLEVYDPATNAWTNQVAQMPRARYGHVSIEHGGRIYVMGGEDEDGNPVAELDVYDVAGNRWSQLADLPTPRTFATVTKQVNVGGITGGYVGLVVAGGRLAGGAATPVVEEYVIDDSVWRERSPLLAARHSGAAVNYTVNVELDSQETRGLVLGGLVAGEVSANGTYFTVAQDYLSRVTPMPTGRFMHAAEALDGRIYLFGGRDFQETRSFWAFDPETGTYEVLPDLPSNQNGLASAVLDGQLYAFGGANAFGVALATARRYDPATRVWTDLQPMTTGRRDLTAVVVGREIWTIGGDNNGPIQTVEIYEPLANRWRAGTLLPTGRAGARAFQRDGVVHVVGGVGANGQPIDSVLRFANNQWQVAFNGVPVAHAQVALVGDKQLNVFGGRGAAGPVNTQYSIDLTNNTFTRVILNPTNLSSAVDYAAVTALNGALYVFGGNTAVVPGPNGQSLVQRIDTRCFDGVRNGREVVQNLLPFDNGGTCPRRQGCAGTLYGDVCLTALSGSCQGGPPNNYCGQFPGSRPGTQAEFIRMINNGWVRPDGNYHTMACNNIAGCGNSWGSVNVPGYGDPNSVYQCGENQNYCSRAIFCVGQ
ncbi:MAG: Kelch repeat-containing protein [Bradymonadia bacterium]